MEKDNLRLDGGHANGRIARKGSAADFRRIESASRKIPVTLHSPEMKRLYMRLFHDMQIQAHYIGLLGRMKLDGATVDQVEEELQTLLEYLSAEADRAIDCASSLCKAHGITKPASYDTVPLALEVRVISRLSRRYLELILKVDQLMPILDTLHIEDLINSRELGERKAIHKRAVRRVAGTARALRYRLQRRITNEQRMLAPANSITAAPGKPGGRGKSKNAAENRSHHARPSTVRVMETSDQKDVSGAVVVTDAESVNNSPAD